MLQQDNDHTPALANFQYLPFPLHLASALDDDLGLHSIQQEHKPSTHVIRAYDEAKGYVYAFVVYLQRL